MPSVAPPRSFTIVSYRPARPAPAFSFLRLATAAAAILLVLVGLGDYLSVYPKEPVPVVTAPATPIPPAPPVAIPTVVAEPPSEPQLTPLPPVSKIREVPVPGMPTPVPVDPGPAVTPEAAATPAPDMALPVTPVPLIPEGTALPPTEPDYLWPVKQIEKGLLVAVVVLFALSVIARQWGYARIRRR